MYLRITDRLRSIGYETTSERVYQVTFYRRSKIVTETVGKTSDEGELVLAIFKDHIGFFVCTYTHGVVLGEPKVARYSAVESSELFEDELKTVIDQA